MSVVTAFFDLGCDLDPPLPVLALHKDGTFELSWTDGKSEMKAKISSDKLDELANWLPSAVEESERLQETPASVIKEALFGEGGFWHDDKS